MLKPHFFFLGLNQHFSDKFTAVLPPCFKSHIATPAGTRLSQTCEIKYCRMLRLRLSSLNHPSSTCRHCAWI